jgi:transaldolase
MIAQDSLTGLTSNPSIFEKAIGHSSDYDADIAAILQNNPTLSTKSLYEQLAIADIQAAADLLRSVYDRSQGADGYVSLEVSPTLAHNTAGSIEEAQRLFTAVNRPNLMIKIPATSAGLPVIRTLIGQGINVNVTLMFSLQHYDAVASAYLQGLETLADTGGNLSQVASVASFFVSRVDSLFDHHLAQLNTAEAQALQGQVGIANAKAAYHRFQETFSTPRFQRLAAQGAKMQRPLWASTSTKNPAYSDVLYIEALLGPHSVNTIPPATVDAFRDHGQAAPRLTENLEAALSTLNRLNALGLDYLALTEQLQEEGVNAFAQSFESLLETLARKKQTLQAQP